MCSNGKNLSDFTYVGNVVASHLLAAEHLTPGSVACGKAYIITNDEPIGFWDFAGLLMDEIKMPRPSIHVPYKLVLGISLFLQVLFAVLSPIVSLKTTFTPQVVRLAGTTHYYNCNRAKNEIGYRPFVSMADGIKISVQYVLARQAEQRNKKK